MLDLPTHLTGACDHTSTAALGTLLSAGYLSGAGENQLRAGAEPFFLVFPLLLAGLVWLEP